MIVAADKKSIRSHIEFQRNSCSSTLRHTDQHQHSRFAVECSRVTHRYQNDLSPTFPLLDQKRPNGLNVLLNHRRRRLRLEVCLSGECCRQSFHPICLLVVCLGWRGNKRKSEGRWGNKAVPRSRINTRSQQMKSPMLLRGHPRDIINPVQGGCKQRVTEIDTGRVIRESNAHRWRGETER